MYTSSSLKTATREGNSIILLLFIIAQQQKYQLFPVLLWKILLFKLQIRPLAVQWIQFSNPDWLDKIYCDVETSTSTPASILDCYMVANNIHKQCQDCPYFRLQDPDPDPDPGHLVELFRHHRCLHQPRSC